MKKALLSFLFIFAAFAMYGQVGHDCGDGTCGDNLGESYNSPRNNSYRTQGPNKVEFKLFPNPATEFIQIDEKSIASGQAKYMRIYSLTGQVVKQYNITKGAEYNIADLRAGTYLIQFLNYKKKVVTTKTFNKSVSF